MHESDIKAVLIDFLLAKFGEEINLVFSELTFQDMTRRADVAVLAEKGLFAYEIKGPRDNTDKLLAQLADYSTCFDYITVVCAEKHIDTVKSLTKEGVGLYTVHEGEIRIHAEPYRNSNLISAKVLSGISREVLLKAARAQEYFKASELAKLAKVELIALLAGSLSVNAARTLAHQFLRAKYTPRYEAFLRERGAITVYEDVDLLTSDYAMGKLEAMRVM